MWLAGRKGDILENIFGCFDNTLAADKTASSSGESGKEQGQNDRIQETTHCRG